jgi:hypothetical protein
VTIELDKEQVKEAREPREPKKGGGDAQPKSTKPAGGLHEDPYSNVKELKDLPD